MNIFRMLSYKSLEFGALILGIDSLLIITTFVTDGIYKFLFNISLCAWVGDAGRGFLPFYFFEMFEGSFVLAKQASKDEKYSIQLQYCFAKQCN